MTGHEQRRPQEPHPLAPVVRNPRHGLESAHPVGVKRTVRLAHASSRSSSRSSPAVPTSRTTSGSPSPRCGGLGARPRRRRRTLGEPHDPRVVTEILVAQLGVAIEPELAHDRVLERAREEVGQEVGAGLLLERDRDLGSRRTRRSSGRRSAAGGRARRAPRASRSRRRRARPRRCARGASRPRGRSGPGGCAAAHRPARPRRPNRAGARSPARRGRARRTR